MGGEDGPETPSQGGRHLTSHGQSASSNWLTHAAVHCKLLTNVGKARKHKYTRGFTAPDRALYYKSVQQRDSLGIQGGQGSAAELTLHNLQ